MEGGDKEVEELIQDPSALTKTADEDIESFQLYTPVLFPPEPPLLPMTHTVYFGGTGGRNRVVKDFGANQRLTIVGEYSICGMKIGKVQHGSPVGEILLDCQIPASGRFRLYSVDIGVFDNRVTVICGMCFSVDNVTLIGVRSTTCREVTRVFQNEGGLEVQIKSIRSDFMLDGMTFMYRE
jgi:hypothetical protein